jgi:hypothetical protein
MTARRPKFRWSDEEIVRAIGPAIADPDDEIIIRDLAEFGAYKFWLAAKVDESRRPLLGEPGSEEY